MKTAFGICPSFANWTSRLPLFADPLRRGRQFEVFKEDGTPTGEPSPLGDDGWPVKDGRWHGVRLFGDMDGYLPHISSPLSDVKLRINAGKSAFVYWPGGMVYSLLHLTPSHEGWHIPSGEAAAYFRPKVLRTLDWGWQARKEKRPNYNKGRVMPWDPLQGEEMALELQIDAANKLNCHLWWNIPPRFELSSEDYQERLEEFFLVLKKECERPPILEYGNELWNEGFPVRACFGQGPDWTARAATEISFAMELANKILPNGGILGERSFYTFVGGHISIPNVLESILRNLTFIPDCAGPAFYVTPLKEHRDSWNQTGEIPSQDQLKESMLASISRLRAKLDAHRMICMRYKVPYFAVYEAGQSLISGGRPWKKAAIEAQRSDWMGGIYREIRKQLSEAEVDLACWYSLATDQAPEDSRVDPFGMLEATLDLAEPLPKAKAARGD